MKVFASLIALAIFSSLPAFAQEQVPSPPTKPPSADNPPLDEGRPLGDVGGRMGVVAEKLEVKDVGTRVQVQQGHIVEHLDELLKRARKNVSKCCGGDGEGEGECDGEGDNPGKRPKKGLNESRLIGGPGGIGDLQGAGQEGKQFGDLPPHLRERILQAKERGFPESYQEILSTYYRRLAEQDAKKEPAPAPKSK
ncbi:MAG TPA: hypothetical protein PKA37_02740 [Planctomycetota bacterium]|jgi:hypothetical protein|nr:hypothetical protein [Planctomycetota bacterium]